MRKADGGSGENVPVSLGVHFPSFLGYSFIQIPVRIDSSGSLAVRLQIVVADEFHLEVVFVIRFGQGVFAQLKQQYSKDAFNQWSDRIWKKSISPVFCTAKYCGACIFMKGNKRALGEFINVSFRFTRPVRARYVDYVRGIIHFSLLNTMNGFKRSTLFLNICHIAAIYIYEARSFSDFAKIILHVLLFHMFFLILKHKYIACQKSKLI